MSTSGRTMRVMGFLFALLTFLAGVTIATIEYALINLVVFCVLALGVARFIEPRFGETGLVFGMAGAFFISFLWPYALILGSEACEGDQCLEAEVLLATPPETP